MTRINRLRWAVWIFILAALPAPVRPQDQEYRAIIPVFHDRLNTSRDGSVLQLQRQQFIVFVYRNAVAVYSEADFVNTGNEETAQEFALPSTGHDENGNEPGGRISSGILSAHMWVGGDRVAPEFIHEGNEDWYTIRTQFGPGEKRKLKAVFWAQTSLSDIDSLPGLDTVAIPAGKRGFLMDLCHARAWNDVIERIDIMIVLKGGLSFERDAFSAEPDTYELQDSTMTWSLRNIEPSETDNILVSYTPSGPWGSSTNTMARLSTYIVKKAYDNLLEYAERLEHD